MVSKLALALSPEYFDVFKFAGFSFMGAGFAGLFLMSLTSKFWLNNILANRLFIKAGRISYSFYLLHELIFPVVGTFILTYLTGKTGLAIPLINTILSATILFFLSLVFYRVFEKPFFKAGNLTTK